MYHRITHIELHQCTKFGVASSKFPRTGGPLSHKVFRIWRVHLASHENGNRKSVQIRVVYVWPAGLGPVVHIVLPAVAAKEEKVQNTCTCAARALQPIKSHGVKYTMPRSTHLPSLVSANLGSVGPPVWPAGLARSRVVLDSWVVSQKWVESESSRPWKSRIWVESESSHADPSFASELSQLDTAWVKVESMIFRGENVKILQLSVTLQRKNQPTSTATYDRIPPPQSTLSVTLQRKNQPTSTATYDRIPPPPQSTTFSQIR